MEFVLERGPPQQRLHPVQRAADVSDTAMAEIHQMMDGFGQTAIYGIGIQVRDRVLGPRCADQDAW